MINKKKVSVIGLGYVGLPLAVAAAKSGFSVVGIDSNINKVNDINNGVSPVEDISNEEIKKLISKGTLIATNNYEEIGRTNIVLICVPTPLLKNQLPDLTMIESAARSMSEYLEPGTLVILESTVSPGTTRHVLAPLIMSRSQAVENSIELVFSPERIDPLNKKWKLKNTPKIVAGLTESSRKRAVQFYSKFVNEVIECDSLEIAETAKLLENSFRLVNISLINEVSKFCYKLGIDVSKVITAAATKPYGFMPFYPSIGAGGHCIPVDPLYLSTKARDIGEPIQLIELASQINLTLPQFFVKKAEEKLQNLKNKKILVIGVSYKPNVSDTRETPVEMLITELKHKGAVVSWHDDLVKVWKGVKSVELSSGFDLVILATPHDYLDLQKIGNTPLINTRESIQ